MLAEDEDYRLTVIIPTFNRACMLSRALDSVLAQTHAAFEVIVVDDGSTDDTSILLAEKYMQTKRCLPLRYIQTVHRGVSHARNVGIRASTTPWVAFLDSDDQWLPHKCATQVEALKKSATYLFCHSEEIWFRDMRRVNPMRKHLKRGGWIYQESLLRCMISPSCVLMHKKICDFIGYFDESLPACEDYDFWLRICACYPVLLCREPLVHRYAGHCDQLSEQYDAMDRFRVSSLQKMLQTDSLNDEDRLLTLQIMQKKLSILIKGARKRDKQSDVQAYLNVLSAYGLSQSSV